MLKQTLGIKNKQVISLKTLNSLNIISLNQADLILKVKEMFSENPFLEEKKGISLENLSQKTSEYVSRSTKQKSYEFFEDQARESQTLSGILNTQLPYFDLTQDLQNIIELIISNLDENGFCDNHWDLVSQKGYSRKKLNLALEVIKKFEPIGACAENSWQAILWQAQSMHPNDTLLQEIITTIYLSKDQLNEVSDSTTKELSQILYVEEAEVQSRFKIIEILDPYPCRKYNHNENYVYPEIEIQEVNNQLEVKIYDILISELSVNVKLYDEFIDSSKKKNANLQENITPWMEKFQEAKSLVSDIAYRHNNLAKVTELILSHQKEFFLKGKNYLKPLNLSDISQKINTNISTVSRIINSKYLQCKWGVFPLKIFFANRIKAIEGINKTAKDLADDIKKLIDNEDKAYPLNDLQLVQELGKIGYKVHRRTVAKYRLEMNIPQAQTRTTNM